MANQPPTRPWFRLPNLARQQPPAPAPAAQPPQQPRIPVIRPAFRPAFTQSQAAPPPPPPPPPQQQQQYAPPPPSSQPAPPSPTPTQPPSPPSPPMRIASPSPSPSPPPSRVVASPSPPPPPPRSYATSSPPPSTRLSRVPTPIASPIKTTRSPPPINLPPPQFNSTMPEAEQEKVLLQETFNKKPVFPNSDQATSIKGFGHKAHPHNHSTKNGSRLKEAAARKSSSSSDSEDGNKNVKIITMTGENKGALMELGFPPRTNAGKTHFPGSGHKLGHGLKEDVEGDLDSGHADRAKLKDHDKAGMETPSRMPMKGYVNSNVQGINNSILYNCSFTHHDPGVHFSVSRKKPTHGKAHHGTGHEHGKKN